MEYCSSLRTFGSVYFLRFIFLDPLKYGLLYCTHLCVFFDPSPGGILLFPLHVWIRSFLVVDSFLFLLIPRPFHRVKTTRAKGKQPPFPVAP